MRIGHGYDAHRFCEYKDLIIGGIKIKYEKGLLAHSDGDVLVHAYMDAILGAAGERDIGTFFPDSDMTYEGADSCKLLEKVISVIKSKGLTIEYADMTIIAQKPKMAEYLFLMREKLSEISEISIERLNIKATTEEKMGFTGRLEGISAHSVVLLNEKGTDE